MSLLGVSTQGGYCGGVLFFQAEDGIREGHVTGVQTCALPISGWGHFGGIVAPQQHNVAGIKVGNPNAADLPADFERFATWSEGIRAHANHLGAYSGAVPVLGPNGEPVHDRYYVVKSAPWAGTVETIGGLSGKWSVREDYGQVLQKRFLDPLRNI